MLENVLTQKELVRQLIPPGNPHERALSDYRFRLPIVPTRSFFSILTILAVVTAVACQLTQAAKSLTPLAMAARRISRNPLAHFLLA